MNGKTQSIYVVRHGETAWSVSGQHTGLTDLPLTEQGEKNARWLGERLAGIPFAKIFRSPLQRAFRTCELAGFGDRAETDPLLVEWNYGDYEGLRSVEIRAKRPDWQLFRDGCPHGESPAQVAARADAVLAQAKGVEGDVLLFSSGHFLRMLAARWLGLEPAGGKYFTLDPASLSVLGFERVISLPVIQNWNETRHVTAGSTKP
jgi:broad specificity phosphatase PhoE